ncbi:MAG: polysaccharide biosynthesis C-terminal domain-containing protein [Bacteroidales bacterium]|nr:polysaccharide biosynthesis C-terminal domain-containing protein [Bacteroidales bacterium]
MIKKVLGTAGSRILTSALSLILVLLYGRTLGPEGAAEIGLVVLGITIVLLLSNFVTGGALVYLTPREKPFLLFLPAYVWAFFSAVVLSYGLDRFHLLPPGMLHHVLFLSLIFSWHTANLNILLGKERVGAFNSASVVQIVTLFTAFLFFVYIRDQLTVMSYVYSLYLSYGLSFLYSLILVLPELKYADLYDLGPVILRIFRYGSFVQFANTLQLLNYRLSYYLIKAFLGNARLGVFQVGNQLSEGLWIVGKSMALVQYSRIANTSDAQYAKVLTVRFLKLTVLVTLILLSVLWILPESFYTWILTDKFAGIKTVIWYLSPGIMAIAGNLILSHFFSGTGRHHHNAISSGIGLFFTVLLGFLLIPTLGISGAAITASVSYMATCTYQMIQFFRLTQVSVRELVIVAEDFRFFMREIRNWIKKSTVVR